MKLRIYEDERWPDYGLSEDVGAWSDVVEVTPELWERYKRIEAEYDELQKELKNLYKSAGVEEQT